MAVTAESFTLKYGACRSNGAEIVNELKREGIASSHSNGVVTVTLTSLETATNVDALQRFSTLLRVAKAGGCKLTYTSAILA